MKHLISCGFLFLPLLLSAQLTWILPESPPDGSTLIQNQAQLDIHLEAERTCIKSSKGKDPVIRVNGEIKPWGALRMRNKKIGAERIESSLTLLPGENRIEVEWGNCKADPIRVIYKPQKSKLFVLAFGVGNDLKYTQQDAWDFISSFRGQIGCPDCLFEDGELRAVFGAGATSGVMREELDYRRTLYQYGSIGPNDLLILFFSSHGFLLDGKLYIQGANFDELEPAATSISLAEITGYIQKIPCKKMIFIDACQQILERKSNRAYISRATYELFHALPGTMVFTSASPGQVSYEHEAWQNGAFSEVLLEGLKGAADKNRDGIIRTEEIRAFLKKETPVEVQKVFPGKDQNPSIWQNDLEDIPFFVCNRFDKIKAPVKVPLPEPEPEKPKPAVISPDTRWGETLLPAGTFEMGSEHGQSDERPIHSVRISQLWVDVRETTFEEFDEFCRVMNHPLPDDKGWGRGEQPVIHVSWYEAVKYCNWRSLKKGYKPCYTLLGTKGVWVVSDLKANGYRLPTEAEWEYIAWLGNKQRNLSLRNVAWFGGNSEGKTNPTARKEPSGQGLFDLYGNVAEWCHDWYREDAYERSSVDNPTGPNKGTLKVVRGGSWKQLPRFLTNSYRGAYAPSVQQDFIGFRCVRNAY